MPPKTSITWIRYVKSRTKVKQGREGQPFEESLKNESKCTFMISGPVFSWGFQSFSPPGVYQVKLALVCPTEYRIAASLIPKVLTAIYRPTLLSHSSSFSGKLNMAFAFSQEN